MTTARAASLFVVFLLAKICALAGHHVPVSWWSPIAYLWQDALVVLVYALVQRLVRREALAWAAYAVLAAYVAINIPVARVLSTPLTWAMWRAARGPLADSIAIYATWPNALLIASALVAAAAAPAVLKRAPPRVVIAGSMTFVALGPAASARVDTLGLDRNAWIALVRTALPRVAANAGAEWDAAGFDAAPREDLSWLRGAAAGRNVVFISLESTAARYLGLYGADVDATPHLSELARTAVVFDAAYAVYPESIKGLFSILCSRYPAFGSETERYASAPCRSLPAVLSDRGYRTALFHSGRFAYLGMEAIVRGRGYDVLADAGDIGGRHNSSFGVDEPSTVAAILRWIDEQPAGRPFFVTYLPIAGHHPYDSPGGGPFPDRDELGRYRNALHYGDASLGDLVRGIRDRGLEDETMWIVFGDHGEAFGQHEGNYGHTFSIYEENVHVPLIVAAPGLIAHPIRSRSVVSLIDAAPSALDLVGLPVPEGYQGRSVLDREPRMALFFADYSLGLLGLRDGPRKFIYEVDSGRSRLFDVERDPGERIDRVEQDRERAAWYRENLKKWSAAQVRRFETDTTPRK